MSDADSVISREELLVDYYYAVVGTDGGDSSCELVLYTYSDTELKLSVFSKSDGEDESRADYLVPVTAFEECEKVIKQNKFGVWNDKYDDIGMDGSKTVVKYKNDDGSYTRVSSDRIPDDGLKKMNDIQTVLRSYVQEQYKQ